MKATKSKSGQIGPINCLRVMSMFWVILCHSMALMAGFSSTYTTTLPLIPCFVLNQKLLSDNVLDILPLINKFFMQIIFNGFFSVDTFFFIGGVLLAFMWFKGYSKDKKMMMSPQGWAMFYVHRFIR